jgi:hypothetical protein
VTQITYHFCAEVDDAEQLQQQFEWTSNIADNITGSVMQQE